MDYEANEKRAKETALPEEPKQEPEEKSLLFDVYTLLHDLVYILAFITFFFVFAIRLVGVDGKSMNMTLYDGDYVALLSNAFYDHDHVAQGDIVVASVPSFEDGKPIVKRVIATEGQTLDLIDGVVYVDGTPLDEEYINGVDCTYEQSDYGYPITVPEGCVFLMGDNRMASRDSRWYEIGMVDTRYLLGKVLFLVWPGTNGQTESRDFGRVGSVS